MSFLTSLLNALPGAVAQGLIWGIMAIGVYITYRFLDVADLTVDGSLATGGAVCVMCLLSGMNVWAALFIALLAGLATGLVTGLLHTFMGITAILYGILTQLALYTINLKIMGKANQSINVDKYDLLISLRWVKELALHNPIIMVILVSAVVIGVLYWFFGTELGCGIRATGYNPAMSRAQGINTSFNVVLGLAVSNGLVALSGALLSQYQGFADVSMGRGAIVIGLAAVIIGEALFSRIFHNFQIMASGDVHDRIHLACYTCIMNRNDCFCFFCDRLFDQFFIDIHGIRPNIHKYDLRSPQHKCICR